MRNLNKEVMFIKPIFKQKIWGGNKLKEEFGFDVPFENAGECWGISAHPEGECVISSGRLEGKKLSDVWKEHPEIFGKKEVEYNFPLLVKIIDAKENLSVQVHPDDNYAFMYEDKQRGKTECWYVLSCDKDANIIIGHNAKDSAEMKKMIENKEWDNFLRVIPVQKGDFFQIEPGTVHAITKGTVILEIQQSSDLVYRIYDYDRLENGVPRQLHHKQCEDVIVAPQVAKVKPTPIITRENCNIIANLVKCEYYKVIKYDIKEELDVEMPKNYILMSVAQGSGTFDGIPIKQGDNFIVPYKYGPFTLDGTMTILRAEE